MGGTGGHAVNRKPFPIMTARELLALSPYDDPLLVVPPLWRGKIKSRGDLLDRIQYETAPDGTEWLVLNLAHDYPIEADRLDTESKLLWWIDHLCGKPWMTIEALDVFIGRVAERNGFGRGAA